MSETSGQQHDPLSGQVPPARTPVRRTPVGAPPAQPVPAIGPAAPPAAATATAAAATGTGLPTRPRAVAPPALDPVPADAPLAPVEDAGGYTPSPPAGVPLEGVPSPAPSAMAIDEHLLGGTLTPPPPPAPSVVPSPPPPVAEPAPATTTASSVADTPTKAKKSWFSAPPKKASKTIEQKPGPRGSATAGGRGGVLALRALVWAVLGLLLLGGLKNVLTTEPDVSIPTLAAAVERASGTKGFPLDNGSAFAARFTATYLTYDPETIETREQALATYSPNATEGDWAVGVSKSQGIKTGPLVVDAEISDEHNATITVGALLSAGGWVYLAVPVYAADANTLVVSGAPGFVAQPAQAIAPATEQDVEYDTELGDQLLVDLFAGFFEAWGTSDAVALQRYTTEMPSGTAKSGLGGALRFREITQARVPARGGSERQAVVDVVWSSPTGEYPQQYRVDISRDAEGRWSVQDVRGGVVAPDGTGTLTEPAAGEATTP